MSYIVGLGPGSRSYVSEQAGTLFCHKCRIPMNDDHPPCFLARANLSRVLHGLLKGYSECSGCMIWFFWYIFVICCRFGLSNRFDSEFPPALYAKVCTILTVAFLSGTITINLVVHCLWLLVKEVRLITVVYFFASYDWFKKYFVRARLKLMWVAGWF